MQFVSPMNDFFSGSLPWDTFFLLSAGRNIRDISDYLRDVFAVRNSDIGYGIV